MPDISIHVVQLHPGNVSRLRFAHKSVIAAASLEPREEGKNFRKAAEPLQRSYISI